MQSMHFSEQVREIVRAIPIGETYSYKEVAEAAGALRSYRAVANIMATNFDPTVPCHRVIKSDGTLGGYNCGGEDAKRKLLEKEGAII